MQYSLLCFTQDAPPPYPGINGYTGYQQSVGAGGFTNPSGASANMSSAEAKAAEAAGKNTTFNLVNQYLGKF